MKKWHVIKMKINEKRIKIRFDWLKLPKLSVSVKLLFTKLNQKFTAFVEGKITAKISEVSKQFYKFNEFPLYNFIECLVNKDYAYLYKVNPKKRYELIEAKYFEDIILEYSEKISGNMCEFQDIIDYYSILSKIRILEGAIGILTNLSDESKIILKRMGIKLTGDIERDYLLITGKLSTFTRKIEELSNKLEKQKNLQYSVYTFMIICQFEHFLCCWIDFIFQKVKIKQFCLACLYLIFCAVQIWNYLLYLRYLTILSSGN